MLTLPDVLAPVPGVVSRESDGELVVVLPTAGKFIVLNPTGAEAFALVNGERTLGEISAMLSERHDVPRERTDADVLALGEKLLDRGAVFLPRRSG